MDIYSSICGHITQLHRIGEESSDATMYASTCNTDTGLVPVAIKVSRRNLDREYRIFKTLENTDLVPKLIDYIPDHVMIMELMEMTLSRYLAENHDISQYNSLAFNITNKLHRLHQFHLIHGDLHTNNVMLKHGMPYFIDFDRDTKSTQLDDLQTLVDSLYGFPLDLCNCIYGSAAYKVVRKRISLFDRLLRSHVNVIYGITLLKEQEQEQEH